MLQWFESGGVWPEKKWRCSFCYSYKSCSVAGLFWGFNIRDCIISVEGFSHC